MATHYVEVVASDEAKAAGTEGMILSDMDVPAASRMLGPLMHTEIASALRAVLQKMT